MDRGPNAAILSQVGQFYSDAVGQFYIGANTELASGETVGHVRPAAAGN